MKFQTCFRSSVFLLAPLVALGMSWTLPLIASGDQRLSQPQEIALWESGKDGYHTYRIPSLIVTKQGTLLAFCEGRKNARSDSGEIHLLVKRSTDGGKTWSPQQIVWHDGPNTCGNPCPVVDETTGTIWLLLTHNLGQDKEPAIVSRKSKGTRTVWVTHSNDDGQTWAAPTEITASTKKPQWTWYATGPGVGIQKRLEPHRGRLVIPCDHKASPLEYCSHVIYSDDHGKTWHLGGRVPQPVFNECQVIELTDGRLMLNMRNHRDRKSPVEEKYRGVAFSSDGGITWTEGKPDHALPEPICQASIIRCSPADEKAKPWLLHSNPADFAKRQKMTVRLSKDDGQTWTAGKVLHPGSAAYSCLAMLPDGNVACLYEADDYQTIILSRFSLDWLAGHAQVDRAQSGSSETGSDLAATASKEFQWHQLPPLPDREGFAGMLAGVCGESLLAAGGANFPDKRPWEGGTKTWYDTIYTLDPQANAWRVAKETLPRAIAYGVSATWDGGVICAGGSDSQRHYDDVFIMRDRDGHIEFESLPALPQPCANGAGAVLGSRLYLLGGTDSPGATKALRNFWSLDLSQPRDAQKWEELEPWPGPERFQPVVSVVGNSLYLVSGIRLEADENGKPRRVSPFLTDAYRFTPSKDGAGGSWKKIADVPSAVAAAPSPAMTLGDDSFAIFGGVDHIVNGLPHPTHPGFTHSVLVYNIASDRWTSAEEMPTGLSRVTAPGVNWNRTYCVVSGERAPGRRSPAVVGVKQGAFASTLAP